MTRSVSDCFPRDELGRLPRRDLGWVLPLPPPGLGMPEQVFLSPDDMAPACACLLLRTAEVAVPADGATAIWPTVVAIIG